MFKRFKIALVLAIVLVVGATTVSAYQEADTKAVEKEKTFSVNITIDGFTAQVETAEMTVGELLEEKCVVISEQDIVNYTMEEEVFADMNIVIESYEESSFTEYEKIDFETERIPVKDLKEGQERVIQNGSEGKNYKKYKVVSIAGKEKSRELIEEGIAVEAVNQIVEYGIPQNTIITSDGECLQYEKVLDMRATAYCPLEDGLTNYTYTGMEATWGVVAVDPSVIPLYSKLYVEGYGEAIAADIGKSIKQNKIDLCYEDLESMTEYGVQNIKVYVLEEYTGEYKYGLYGEAQR